MTVLLQVQVSQAEDEDQWAFMYTVITLKKSMLSYWSKIYFIRKDGVEHQNLW